MARRFWGDRVKWAHENVSLHEESEVTVGGLTG